MLEKQPKTMNAFLLQIKGDTSFSLFSQVTDVESLSETWKLCTKVAGHLEQGKRLENLSWRLFHLHSTMAAESVYDRTRTFERISKETGKKLDQERHLGLSQLQDPPLKCCRRMNPPISAVSATIHHPTLLCSLSSPTENGTGGLVNCTTITSSTHISFSPPHAWDLDFNTGSINFESLISSFSPLAVWGPVDHFSQQNCNLLENEGTKIEDTSAAWGSFNYPSFNDQTNDSEPLYPENEITKEYSTKFEPVQKSTNISHENNPSSFDRTSSFFNNWEPHGESLERKFVGPFSNLNDQISTLQNPEFNKNSEEELQALEMSHNPIPIVLGSNSNIAQENTDFSINTNAFSASNIQTNPKAEKVGEKRKRRNPMATRLPKFVGGPTLSERTPDKLSEKSICFNCRGTHTPLWRRGPNDEILCNACGVFYNVHKKNRPPNLSKGNYLGNSNSKVNGDTSGQRKRIECTNCNAKATPMWRKAPDGSLLCNACALYFKCHKRSRPANCSKTEVSQPLGVVNQLSNFTYSNKNTSIRIRPQSFEFYNNDSEVFNDPKNNMIESLENEFDRRNIYFNEPHEFDFFKTYPACFYTTPNL